MLLPQRDAHEEKEIQTNWGACSLERANTITVLLYSEGMQYSVQI